MRTLFIGLIGFLWLPYGILSQNECRITYIANEGFLIETGGKKIAIDAMFDTIRGNWCDSPSRNVIGQMKKAASPFDSIDLIVISHYHTDHFNESIVASHMLNNPHGVVICPQQVTRLLSKDPDYEKFRDRIISLTPALYSDTLLIASGISVRVLRLEHSPYIEIDSTTGIPVNLHKDVENLGCVFTVNGIVFFHCGDTNPLNEKEYSGFSMQDEKINIAFLERLFFMKGKKAEEILDTYIKPQNIIVMHIDPVYRKMFLEAFKETGNIRVFEKEMDSMDFQFDDSESSPGK
jgi:L-ascorbate metabolism protein UlaG (beta-lactamase superfamily)